MENQELIDVLNEIKANNRKNSEEYTDKIIDLVEKATTDILGDPMQAFGIIVYHRTGKDINVARSAVSSLRNNFTQYDDDFLYNIVANKKWDTNIEDMI